MDIRWIPSYIGLMKVYMRTRMKDRFVYIMGTTGSNCDVKLLFYFQSAFHA